MKATLRCLDVPAGDGFPKMAQPSFKEIANMAAKTTCPISRDQFEKEAKALEVVINGVPYLAEARSFSTGSLGWYLNGKATIRVGDTPVSVQIGMNLTIVGSKELPKAKSEPAAESGSPDDNV
jgi:hypothetical protein